MFNVITSQCTDLMITKLESKILWKQVKSSSNAVGLLTYVRNISFRYESQCYLYKAMHNSMRSFYIMYQQDGLSLEKYLDSFVNSIDVVKHSDRVIGEHPKLGNYILKMDGNAANTNATIIVDAVTRSNKAYLAYASYQEPTERSIKNF
eukprot:11354012-Ditylum_brightwellii.AAC.1